MPRKKTENANNTLALIVIGAFLLTALAAGLNWWSRHHPPPHDIEAPGKTAAPVAIDAPPVLEYHENGISEQAQAVTEQRKNELGLAAESLDLLLKADESLKLGDTVVSMEEILDRIRLKRGDIVETEIDGTAPRPPMVDGADNVYGIHVVKPGDNIWNIHFRFLRDYFQKRGVSLSPVSDEATAAGYSSGVGKILKFSENMVYIYNVRDRRLDVDLDMIHPLTKVIVFDMGRVLALLDQIDFNSVNRIQFDGETLWIPAAQ